MHTKYEIQPNHISFYLQVILKKIMLFSKVAHQPFLFLPPN